MKKLLLAFFLCTGLCFAQNFDYSGNFSVLTGLGLPYTCDNAGSFLSAQVSFDNLFKAYLNESMFYFNAVLAADATKSQSTNGISSFVSDDGIFALKLKEAYYDYNGGWWALRAGRQISAWGKADGIEVADVLCPKDESNMIAETYKESRLGIDAIRLSFMGNWIQADLYWIPLFTPSILPLAENGPLRKIVFPSVYEGMSVSGIDSWGDFSLPSLKIYNSEYAARFGMYFSKFDLSFYGFFGWDDTPFMIYTVDFDKNNVTRSGEYEHMTMVGADAAIPCGDFVFRLETAFFPQRHFQTSSEYQAEKQKDEEEFDYYRKREEITGLFGIDWSITGGWTITAQYRADGITGSARYLERERFLHQATLSIEKAFFNETLNVSALGLLDLNEFSSMAEISMDYSLNDYFKLGLVGNLFFTGIDENDGLYGIYRDLSCVSLKGSISF